MKSAASGKTVQWKNEDQCHVCVPGAESLAELDKKDKKCNKKWDEEAHEENKKDDADKATWAESVW